MKGMILAAGFGTRFRPVTWSVPKPMIPVCNHPLIGWAADSMIDAGIDDIIVNLHHLPEPIERWLPEWAKGRVNVTFSLEDEILGTGGGIRKVRPVLADSDTFVVMNGDTIQFPPFRELISARRNLDALSALLLRHAPEGDKFTSVWFEHDLINAFGDDGRGEPLMFAGAHAMSPAIFDLLPDRPFSGLTEHVYVPAVVSGSSRITAIVHDGLWFDVGTPRRYIDATSGLLQAMADGKVAVPAGSSLSDGSLIHDEATLRGRATGSVIGRGTSIDNGATLENAVIWEDGLVASSCLIRSSILSHGVSLDPGTRVENALVSRSTGAEEPEDHTRRVGDWLVRPIDSDRPWRFE